MTAAAAAAAALFFILWWMLQAEDSPWVPAGLAASVVMLVAASARILVARRVHNHRKTTVRESPETSVRRPTLAEVMHSTSRHAAALRALQRQSAAADEKDALEMHWHGYVLCNVYLASADKALQSGGLAADNRVALRSGQERVRDMQRHHLLTWARNSARSFTHEAQQRVRLYEKVETANRALDCIDRARRIYPDDEELAGSAQAVHEFITSSRVAHWIELAERAAFKGYFQRAIDCYRDALYYLGRDTPGAAGNDAAERIVKEIDTLRTCISTEAGQTETKASDSRRQRRSTPEIN